MNVSQTFAHGPILTQIDARRLGVFVLAVFAVLAAASALAGTDVTFATMTTTLTNWETGSLGKSFALAALGVGLAATIMSQKMMGVGIGVGTALAASLGPTVLSGIFTATL